MFTAVHYGSVEVLFRPAPDNSQEKRLGGQIRLKSAISC